MEVEDDELAVARGLVGEGAHGLGGVPVAVRALRADGVDAREVGDVADEEGVVDGGDGHEAAGAVAGGGHDVGGVGDGGEADGEEGADGGAHEGDHERALGRPGGVRAQRGDARGEEPVGQPHEERRERKVCEVQRLCGLPAVGEGRARHRAGGEGVRGVDRGGEVICSPRLRAQCG